MTNDQMKPGRYLKLHIARKKVAWTKARIAEGRVVYLTSGISRVKIVAKNVECLKPTKQGLMLQSGKRLESVHHHELRAA